MNTKPPMIEDHVIFDNDESKPNPEDLLYRYKEMCLNMQYYMEYCEQVGYVTPMKWLKELKHF